MAKGRYIKIPKRKMAAFQHLKKQIEEKKIPVKFLKSGDEFLLMLGNRIKTRNKSREEIWPFEHRYHNEMGSIATLEFKPFSLNHFKVADWRIKVPSYFKATKGKKGLYLSRIRSFKQAGGEIGLAILENYAKKKGYKYILTHTNSEKFKEILKRHGYKLFATGNDNEEYFIRYFRKK